MLNERERMTLLEIEWHLTLRDDDLDRYFRTFGSSHSSSTRSFRERLVDTQRWIATVGLLVSIGAIWWGVFNVNDATYVLGGMMAPMFTPLLISAAWWTRPKRLRAGLTNLTVEDDHVR